MSVAGLGPKGELRLVKAIGAATFVWIFYKLYNEGGYIFGLKNKFEGLDQHDYNKNFYNYFMDLDLCIEQIKNGELLNEITISEICQRTFLQLMEESNVPTVSLPAVVCGDIHGQFFDLLNLFHVGGSPTDSKYVFLGDYVDRGHHSIETLTLLLLYKLKWPDQIILVRGNHESRQISQVYGFYDECHKKYGSATVWKLYCQLFDYMPVSAIIDGRIFCVHGGLSPELSTVDQIRTIKRAQEIPDQGALCDLVWSDPEDLENGGWAVSPRGAGFLFGSRAVSEFCRLNGINLVCRAHQLVQEGYRFMFAEKSLVTIWSAPNYCYRCGNVASIMKLNDNSAIDESCFVVFDAAEASRHEQDTSYAMKMYFQ